MQEHPVLSLDPLKYNLLGKIQDEGQLAGSLFDSNIRFSDINSLELNISSSETTCEVYVLKDNLFKLWFIGFVEGDGS